MLLMSLCLIAFGLLVPIYCTPQVVEWGIQKSIGKSPYDPKWYDIQNYTEGVYQGGNYLNWPNGIIPYEFDYNATNLGGNTTLRNAFSFIFRHFL